MYLVRCTYLIDDLESHNSGFIRSAQKLLERRDDEKEKSWYTERTPDLPCPARTGKVRYGIDGVCPSFRRVHQPTKVPRYGPLFGISSSEKKKKEGSG